eukprot:m51a1_g7574 hypothetical protein (859) ;mRNA; r:176799-179933
MAEPTTPAAPPPSAVPQPAPLPLQALPSFDVMAFSPALQAAIDEVNGPAAGTHALDKADFDPVQYINELFPTEESLKGVDERIARLQAKVRRLDEEIVASVRTQAASGMKGRKDLDSARTSIRELFKKLNDIKMKAEASESMVTEICRDIKTLDNGKRNLTQAIKVLKKIQMLTSGVDQLRSMLFSHQYGPAAKKLEAVSQLAAEFAPYAHVRKIQEMAAAITSLRDEAYQRSLNEFKSSLETKQPLAPLAEVCEVVDALGDAKRAEFISWFCDSRMEEYRTVFNEWAESSRLENVEKRYMWLRGCLQRYRETWHEVFPLHWDMPEKLATEFCTLTRLSLMTILNKDRESIQVTALVSALKETIEFEKVLVDKFEPADDTEPAVASIDDDDGEYNGGSDEDDEDEEGAKKSKKKKEDGPELAPPPKKFHGILSSVFDPYMDLYVAEEDRNTKEVLEKALAEEQWMLEDDAPNKMLGSSTDLIYFMKTSMLGCINLSVGQPLFDLHIVFRKHMRAYAAALSAHLPAENGKLGDKELRVVCLVLNTAEFCRSRCEQFETTFRRKVAPKFKSKIDLKGEVSEFKQICARGVKLLATLLCGKLEPALNEMVRMPWATMDSVGDSSPYVGTIMAVVGADAPVIYKWLNECPGMKTQFYSIFCDLFVSIFGAAMLDSIYKCKRIGEYGTHNLLLDVTCLRTMLLQLPSAGAQAAGSAASALGLPAEGSGMQEVSEKQKARFTRQVDAFMKKAEHVLKIVMAPQETLVKTYRGMFPEGTLEEFLRVIDLKGLSRAERQALSEAFQAELKAAGIAVSPQPAVSTPVLGAVPQQLAAINPAQATRKLLGKMMETIAPLGGEDQRGKP